MKVYVAGPMTGYGRYNHAAFLRAQHLWRADGHTVTTPFDTNSLVWQRHYGRPFDPAADRCEYGDPLLQEMFAEDLRVAIEADAIVLLDGWQASKGATVEATVAYLFRKEFYSEQGEPLKITPAITFVVESLR